MLDPDAVAARTFGTSFRGYDTEEVRRFLQEVAADLRALASGAIEGISDDRAAALLGEEAGRLLGAARTAAAAAQVRAEEKAAELRREAQDEAIRRRATIEAERDRALAEGAARAEEALAEAERTREAITVEARAEADRLVAEAVAAREHVLRDLARRRKSVRAQVEQLHAAREKMLESLTDVAAFVESARGRLVVALPEAKIAADAAARRAEDEPETTVEQLESELEAFRMVGISLGPTEPAQVVEDAGAGDEEAGDEEAEPEEPPGAMVEGRKSSSLRVFRTRRDPVPVLGSAEPELHEVTPAASFEEVRLIEPEGEPEPEHAEAEADATVEPEPDAPTEVPVPPEDDASLDAGAVDALFARLRADREDRTAAAEAVLAAEPDTDAEVDASTTVEDVAVHVGGGDARSDLLARRDELLAEPVAALLRRFKRLLADEQNEVLDALRRTGVGPDAVATPADLAARWADAATIDLAAAADAGVAFLGGADVAPPDLDDVARDLADAVAEPLAERLVASVERADGDHDLAADSVRSVCREWRARRLADNVDHAVRAAFGRGALAAAEQAGGQLCWVVDDGGSPCPDAEDNALAGAVPAGGVFPTGHRHPPAHPGCRCVLALS